MKKIISIPPNYFYLGIILIIILYFLFPSFNIIKYPYNLLGAIFIIFGFFLISWTYLLFKKYKTPEKFEKSIFLVTQGPYKFSRNPMYLGAVIFLIGLAALFQNILGFISPILFFLIMHFMFIPYEEKKTEKDLGKKYLSYKKKVRRWI